MSKYLDERLNSYCKELRKYILLVGKTNDEARREAEAHQLSACDAFDLYNYPYGIDVFDFGLARPSEELLSVFEMEQRSVSNDSQSAEDCLLNDISSANVRLEVMRDGKLMVVRDRRCIYVGYDYDNQATLDAAIKEALDKAVIDWSEAKLFFHIWSKRFYISDDYEPEVLNNSIEDDIYVEEVTFRKDMTSLELIAMAEKKLVELLNAGFRPRFFRNASYIMNRINEGDEYDYDAFDSFAGYIYKYISVLALTNFLDIEEHESTFVVTRVDLKGYNKKPSHSHVCSDVTFCLDDMIEDVADDETQPFSKTKPMPALGLDLPNSFVGIDFETLYSQRVSACSVGMVKYKNGVIVDRYYTLIRPPFDYPGKCGQALTWVHGFTESMLENERTFDEVLPEMEAFAEGLPLVAHNACVERACIKDASAYYGKKTVLDYENIFDTYPLSRRVERLLGQVIEGPGTHSLDAICRRFNVPEMKHHNALEDAEMCGNLFLALFAASANAGNIVIKKTIPTSNNKAKINPEDKVQRADLENVCDNPFKDKVVVLTGFAKTDSQQYAHQLNELGAIIKDTVNKKTNILITGYNAGPSKMQKATELGVQIMPENELKEILKTL